MTEAFLHHVWQHQLFKKDDLKTTEGDSLEIIKVGDLNRDAGPDFFSASIRINGTLWIGTVEIHLNSSEWRKHKHEQDAAYDNCILHVVYVEDESSYRNNGQKICCLELKGRLLENVLENYLRLLDTHSWIPCTHRIREVDQITILSWLDRLAVERLEQKTSIVFQVLENNENDWEKAFYELLFAGFGFNLNALPFSMLFRALPFELIQRFRDKPIKIEALLFGSGGMLGLECPDQYSKILQDEYAYFRNAYNLQSIDASCWKFLRLRPVNFPTIRIAQLANLLTRTNRLFSEILEIKDFAEGKKIFQVAASSYWSMHYNFGKKSPERRKILGNKSIESIFINVIAPVLFSYGMRNNSLKHRDRAVLILEEIAAEVNSIISKWIEIGIKPQSALHSQALLTLKKNYCSEKKCLTCGIGISLINKLP
ncbi:MAG TPA: DUF2851 family protein [Bacteroidia bacterium]|nr:DUF2851 family protein [Bacteroidia bacterium]